MSQPNGVFFKVVSEKDSKELDGILSRTAVPGLLRVLTRLSTLSPKLRRRFLADLPHRLPAALAKKPGEKKWSRKELEEITRSLAAWLGENCPAEAPVDDDEREMRANMQQPAGGKPKRPKAR